MARTSSLLNPRQATAGKDIPSLWQCHWGPCPAQLRAETGGTGAGSTACLREVGGDCRARCCCAGGWWAGGTRCPLGSPWGALRADGSGSFSVRSWHSYKVTSSACLPVTILQGVGLGGRVFLVLCGSGVTQSS